MPTSPCPYCAAPTTAKRETCASRSCIAKHAYQQRRAENAARDDIAARFADKRGEQSWARVPYFDRQIKPADPESLRAFRAELREAIREAVKLVDEPLEFEDDPTPLVDAGCIACRGFCCELGKGHAFLDPEHLAMLMRARPADSPAAVYRDYVRRIPVTAYQNSCPYHGEKGCALPRARRSLICNAYECNARTDFAKKIAAQPRRTLVVAMDGDKIRAAVIAAPDAPVRKVKT